MAEGIAKICAEKLEGSLFEAGSVMVSSTFRHGYHQLGELLSAQANFEQSYSSGTIDLSVTLKRETSCDSLSMLPSLI